MENDGPAFPANELDYVEFSKDGKGTIRVIAPPSQGMSLRDWFAGMAMQALTTGLAWSPGKFIHREDELAQDSYGIADAMLAEREKEKEKT